MCLVRTRGGRRARSKLCGSGTPLSILSNALARAGFVLSFLLTSLSLSKRAGTVYSLSLSLFLSPMMARSLSPGPRGALAHAGNLASHRGLRPTRASIRVCLALETRTSVSSFKNPPIWQRFESVSVGKPPRPRRASFELSDYVTRLDATSPTLLSLSIKIQRGIPSVEYCRWTPRCRDRPARFGVRNTACVSKKKKSLVLRPSFSLSLSLSLSLRVSLFARAPRDKTRDPSVQIRGHSFRHGVCLNTPHARARARALGARVGASNTQELLERRDPIKTLFPGDCLSRTRTLHAPVPGRCEERPIPSTARMSKPGGQNERALSPGAAANNARSRHLRRALKGRARLSRVFILPHVLNPHLQTSHQSLVSRARPAPKSSASASSPKRAHTPSVWSNWVRLRECAARAQSLVRETDPSAEALAARASRARGEPSQRVQTKKLFGF